MSGSQSTSDLLEIASLAQPLTTASDLRAMLLEILNDDTIACAHPETSDCPLCRARAWVAAEALTPAPPSTPGNVAATIATMGALLGGLLGVGLAAHLHGKARR